jgi:hypothetical protein
VNKKLTGHLVAASSFYYIIVALWQIRRWRGMRVASGRMGVGRMDVWKMQTVFGGVNF